MKRRQPPWHSIQSTMLPLLKKKRLHLTQPPPPWCSRICLHAHQVQPHDGLLASSFSEPASSEDCSPACGRCSTYCLQGLLLQILVLHCFTSLLA
ncbi:hypothetical protein BRADI_2g36501v3 [Brachypodium distachyon]|uniref:Uncharacterized protein n=1 Tax=Brachypodium distachyon TaxID=15368 RepID=A0A2K2DC66_BRADI|nr:hypothetical protein BRADI_2g36501v3 [Brachypodium distachyon]